MQFIKKVNQINNTDIISGNFSIYSISANHSYITPPSTHVRYATEHKNDRIIYIASGKATFDMYNNKPVIAESGSIVYIPYNIAYKADWTEGEKGEVYSINFVMADVNGYQINLCPEICKFEECNKRMMESLFIECYKTFYDANYAHIIKCKYLLYKMLYVIISMQEKSGNSKIGKAIKFLELNYLSDVSIKDLADMCNLGECMFRRYFKEETGLSPLKYRNKLRIMHAYDILTNEPFSVAEVMEITGFYDASYFNKTFKLYIGKSPSECRHKNE